MVEWFQGCRQCAREKELDSLRIGATTELDRFSSSLRVLALVRVLFVFLHWFALYRIGSRSHSNAIDSNRID